MKKIIISLFVLLAAVSIGFAQKTRVGYQLEYSCYNSNVLVIHTDKKMSEDVEASFLYSSITPLVESLLKIDGVIQVRVDKYEIHLTKANLFSWSVIFPKAKWTMGKNFDYGFQPRKTPIYGTCEGLPGSSKKKKPGIKWGGTAAPTRWYISNCSYGYPLTYTACGTY